MPYLLFQLDCKFNCHKRCASKVPKDCLGEVVFNGGTKQSFLVVYQFDDFWLFECLSCNMFCVFCKSRPVQLRIQTPLWRWISVMSTVTAAEARTTLKNPLLPRTRAFGTIHSQTRRKTRSL